MDVGNLIQLGAQLFQGQLDKNRDGQLGITEIASALMSLMASNQSTQAQGGGLGGLGGLVSMLSGLQGGGVPTNTSAVSTGNSDLMSILNSWISTGPNKPVTNSQLTQMLGHDNVSAFAQQLGLNQDQALDGLKAAVPAMVDKATPNGSLDLNSLNSILNSVGGISGALNMASKIFGR